MIDNTIFLYLLDHDPGRRRHSQASMDFYHSNSNLSRLRQPGRFYFQPPACRLTPLRKWLSGPLSLPYLAGHDSVRLLLGDHR